MAALPSEPESSPHPLVNWQTIAHHRASASLVLIIGMVPPDRVAGQRWRALGRMPVTRGLLECVRESNQFWLAEGGARKSHAKRRIFGIEPVWKGRRRIQRRWRHG